MTKQIVVLALTAMLVSSGTFAKSYWGTISVDQSNGSQGTAYNFQTPKEAVDASISSCLKKGGGPKCEPIWTWVNGCAAVVWSPKNKSTRIVTAETSSELSESKIRALQLCEDAEKDSSCEVVASACTAKEATYDLVKKETSLFLSLLMLALGTCLARLVFFKIKDIKHRVLITMGFGSIFYQIFVYLNMGYLDPFAIIALFTTMPITLLVAIILEFIIKILELSIKKLMFFKSK